MTNYVKDYKRAEQTAANAEGLIDTYSRLADEHRWDQCRIAHEAVESGEYSRASFGRAVGKDKSHIARQVKVWEQYGVAGKTTQLSYGEAFAEVQGYARIQDKQADVTRSRARNLPATEKAKLAAELLEDEDVADEPAVAEAVERHNVRRARSEESAMRSRGADPDLVEPFPADLIAEAVKIAGRQRGIATDVDRLLARAEPDQRPRLVEEIEPAVRRTLDRLDAGTVKVPDYVPDDL